MQMASACPHSHAAYSRVQFPLGARRAAAHKIKLSHEAKNLYRVILASTREELLRNYLAHSCCILVLRTYSFTDANWAFNDYNFSHFFIIILVSVE